MFRTPILLLATVTLAACDRGSQGTSISINTSGEDGDFVAGMDGNSGQLKIKAPGFSGNLKLPRITLDANDFDLNGVHLFPGSTISGMNIDAQDRGGADDSGKVRISFASPATPNVVRDWFLDKLSKEAGFKVQASGNGIAGTTDENKPFSMELAPDGAGKAKGVIVLGS